MRRISIVVLSGALALLGAACGDDDDSADASTDGDEGAGQLDGDGDDAFLDLIGEDCQFLLAGSFLNPLASMTPGGDMDIESSAEQLDAIADNAPDEIRDDMHTIADGYSQMAAVFEDVDLDDPSSFSDPEVIAAIEELDSVFDEEYEAASERVSTYMVEHCSDG